MAIVYIYRPPAMPNVMYSPDLHIDGEFRLTIKNGKNNRLIMQSGEHQFTIDPEQNYHGDTSLTLSLAEGDTRFIRVSTSLKITSSSNYEPYGRSFNLTAMDNTLAIKEISNCCHINNEEKLKTESTSEETGKAGFSVDKTQNPFSH